MSLVGDAMKSILQGTVMAVGGEGRRLGINLLWFEAKG